MPDSRRIHDMRCLERLIHGGFITELVITARAIFPYHQGIISCYAVLTRNRYNHRALRHQAKSSPATPIQWALFETWKPKDGSVDIDCLLMVPEVAENPQTAGQP